MHLKHIKIGLKGNAAGVALLATTSIGSMVLAFDQWLNLLIWIAVMYFLMTAMRASRQRLEPTEHIAKSIPEVIAQVMDVIKIKERNGFLFYSGELRQPPDVAYKILTNAYEGKAVPMLEDTWSGKQITLIPGRLDNFVLNYKPRPVLHVILAFITLLSTTFAGAHHLGYQSITSFSALLAGMSYSVPLLTILGIHELGHFVVARIHGMIVTLPFFIPLPFGLGTLGALIQVKSPAMDRESLFDMAIAGPLAGFVTSIPVLLLGLQNSIITHPAVPQVFMTGTFWDQTPVSGSILLSFLAGIARGGVIQYGDVLKLSPLALAGWIGLWVTAFNLLPIGQLDGGHVAQSMFGSKWSEVLTRGAMFLLLFLSIFVWPVFLFGL